MIKHSHTVVDKVFDCHQTVYVQIAAVRDKALYLQKKERKDNTKGLSPSRLYVAFIKKTLEKYPVPFVAVCSVGLDSNSSRFE